MILYIVDELGILQTTWNIWMVEVFLIAVFSICFAFMEHIFLVGFSNIQLLNHPQMIEVSGDWGNYDPKEGINTTHEATNIT